MSKQYFPTILDCILYNISQDLQTFYTKENSSRNKKIRTQDENIWLRTNIKSVLHWNLSGSSLT